MFRTRLYLFLFFFVAGDFVGASVLEVKDGITEGVAEEGFSFEITWEQDLGANPDLIDAKITHVHSISTRKRILGKVSGLAASDVESGYSISASLSGSKKIITLGIESVSQLDDGNFICIVLSTVEDAETWTSEFELFLPKPLETVEFSFYRFEIFVSTPKDLVEVESGTYPAMCIGVGSNPPVKDIKILIDGKEAALTRPYKTMKKYESGSRKYYTIISTNVILPEGENISHQLQCMAKDYFGNTKNLELKVNVVKGEKASVQCQKTVVSEGQGSVSIECLVDHTNAIVTKYAIQRGKGGLAISPGSGDQDNYQVMTKVLSNETTSVTLTFANVTKWHFKSDNIYLLVFSSKGHVTRERLRVTKKAKRLESNINNSTNFYNNGNRTNSNAFSGLLCLARTVLLLSALLL